MAAIVYGICTVYGRYCLKTSDNNIQVMTPKTPLSNTQRCLLGFASCLKPANQKEARHLKKKVLLVFRKHQTVTEPSWAISILLMTNRKKEICIEGLNTNKPSHIYTQV